MDEHTRIQRHFSDILFETQESGEGHNPYEQEKREQAAIREGNLEQLKESIAETITGNYGRLSKNELRHWKNLAIVVISLASRSAIEGGVPYEVAFSLSDGYINRIEEINDYKTLVHFTRQAEFQYAQMVHDIKETNALGNKKKQKNPHIHKCKNYIYAHLHEKILLSDIADELGLNPNYLTDLFHECEGITITDYILRAKIDIAKNLLIYSQYTYTEIATYLGFSSQSHFGKCFKQITDTTPGAFRNDYKATDFT